MSAGAVLVTAGPALATSPNIVISEVYGGGGNVGSTLKNDFIELYNNSSSDVVVPAGGWSVQYFSSSSGNTGGSTVIPAGTVLAAGRYFLIQETGGMSGTVNLPTPDITGTVNLSGTSGEVALVSSTAALTSPIVATTPTGTSVIDFVGYGLVASTKAFEGSAPAPVLTVTTSDSRVGNIDTDQNGTDFAAGIPSPTNSTAAATAPPASLPEAPAALMLPGAGILALLGGLTLRRRRTARA